MQAPGKTFFQSDHSSYELASKLRQIVLTNQIVDDSKSNYDESGQ